MHISFGNAERRFSQLHDRPRDLPGHDCGNDGGDQRYSQRSADDGGGDVVCGSKGILLGLLCYQRQSHTRHPAIDADDWRTVIVVVEFFRVVARQGGLDAGAGHTSSLGQCQPVGVYQVGV